MIRSVLCRPNFLGSRLVQKECLSSERILSLNDLSHNEGAVKKVKPLHDFEVFVLHLILIFIIV